MQLERYLSLEKEVQHLQTQIQTMYQSNKQLAAHTEVANKEAETFCHQQNPSIGEDLCTDPTENGPSHHPPSQLLETPSPAPEEALGDATSHRDQSASDHPPPLKEQTKPHQCKECGKQYSSQRGLRRHFKNHQKGETPCDLCDKIFDSHAARKAHYRLAHADAETANAPLQCSECSRTFDKRSNYLYHVKVYHGPREHKCPVCGKAFVSLPALTTHSRIHSGEKPFACQTCGREFNVKSNLIAHTPLCTGTFKHRCEQCNKGFASNSLFQIHMKVKKK